jgi:Domain of unknown function (DUF3854)
VTHLIQREVRFRCQLCFSACRRWRPCSCTVPGCPDHRPTGVSRGPGAHLAFLLSSLYDTNALTPEHLADLRKSSLTDETIRTQKIRTVPPALIDALLGFRAPNIRSAYVIPFPDPRGGWFDHIKMRVFSAEGSGDVRGGHVEQHRKRWRYNNGARKYLVRRAAYPWLFFPIATMADALEGAEALYLVEGEKKSLAVAQLGLPAVGIESAWGWHEKESRDLLPDFDTITLRDRIVELIPDSDVETNPQIMRSIRHLALALEGRGAHPRLVVLPEVPAT